MLVFLSIPVLQLLLLLLQLLPCLKRDISTGLNYYIPSFRRYTRLSIHFIFPYLCCSAEIGVRLEDPPLVVCIMLPLSKLHSLNRVLPHSPPTVCVQWVRSVSRSFKMTHSSEQAKYILSSIRLLRLIPSC